MALGAFVHFRGVAAFYLSGSHDRARVCKRVWMPAPAAAPLIVASTSFRPRPQRRVGPRVGGRSRVGDGMGASCSTSGATSAAPPDVITTAAGQKFERIPPAGESRTTLAAAFPFPVRLGSLPTPRPLASADLPLFSLPSASQRMAVRSSWRWVSSMPCTEVTPSWRGGRQRWGHRSS